MSSAWSFAVDAWGRPAVERICLDLQIAHAQLPALLLWRLWTLAESRAVGPEQLATAIRVARDWEGLALAPLREVRQRLAAPLASMSVAAREGVRARVAQAELEAERALIDALESLVGGRAGGAAESLQPLVELAAAWRPPAPAALLARLVEAL